MRSSRRVRAPSLRDDYRSNRASTSATCAHLAELPAGLKVGSLVLRAARRWPRFRRGSTSASSTSGAVPGCRPGPTRRRSGSGGSTWPGAGGSPRCPRAGPPGAARRLGLRGPARAARGAPGAPGSRIANTGITSLPDFAGRGQLRWRGVPIDGRIAFSSRGDRGPRGPGRGERGKASGPLERVGIERFLGEARGPGPRRGPRPGGVRRLLRVPMPDDEDLVCVMVHWPVHQGTLPAPRPADREDLPPPRSPGPRGSYNPATTAAVEADRPAWRQVFTVGGTRSR